MTRSALMVMQVALGTLLLVGAGLFVHGLHNLLAIDPGIDFEHLATVSVDLRSAGYDDARAARFFDEAIGPLHRVPGVRHATVVSQPPLSDAFGTRFYVVPDSAWNDAVLASDPSEMLQRMQRGDIALAAAVGPQYFTTVGTPMLAGRDFGEQDVKGSTPVVIVNRTFAERDWPGESALGRCIDVVVDMRNMGDTQCYRVIGVAADAKYARLDEPQRAALFLPLSQDPIPNPRRNLLLRTAAAPVDVASAVRKSLAELDPDLPYVEVRPLAAELRPRLEAPRLGAALLSAFGALALVLAAIGLYGVVAYAVEQRRHEIGIRMALGAEARSVLSLVVREGMRLTLAGLAIGLAGSFGAARLIAHLLHGVGPADPLAFAGAAALFAAVGLLASVIPALRAARLDPAVTLRNE